MTAPVEIVPVTPPPVDQCRVCGCTSAAPCRLPNGDECGWTSKRQTLCTADKCIREAARRDRAEKKARQQALRECTQPVLEKVRKARAERQRKRSHRSKTRSGRHAA